MKINEAIILAGGPGTRLRDVVPDLPKCMAPVAGKPFLAFIIDYFYRQGIDKFIFSLGYMHQVIEDFVQRNYPDLTVQFSTEQEPLGTGGAIKLACGKVSDENVLILNGDTFYSIDISKVAAFHFSKKADCTLTLKPMHAFDRYGAVETYSDQLIKDFKEKRFNEEGLISGGVYILNKTAFIKQGLPDKFSFEKDYLEVQVNRADHKIYGLLQDQYFIDIGVPQDFNKAQKEMLNRV